MKNALALVILASLAGCGAPDSNDDTVTAGLDDKADSAAQKALPDGAQHIYFGSPAGAYLSSDSSLSYSWFTANKGSQFKVTVAENDENGKPMAGQHLGFKLQRESKSGSRYSWSVVDQASGKNGTATLDFKPGVGPSLYLITATVSSLPADLTISLSCSGSGCATARQVGQSCGGIAGGSFVCDAGLFCEYTVAQSCGSGDQAGVCASEPKICEEIYQPVCGCDGKTYGNSCQANGAGTSEAHLGPCGANVVGSWLYIDKSLDHYQYTFNADGTFSASNQPGCEFTNPHCDLVVAPQSGSYSTTTTDVTLIYNNDLGNGRTVDLAIQKSGTHLDGTDFGAKIDLTRVK